MKGDKLRSFATNDEGYQAFLPETLGADSAKIDIELSNGLWVLADKNSGIIGTDTGFTIIDWILGEIMIEGRNLNPIRDRLRLRAVSKISIYRPRYHPPVKEDVPIITGIRLKT